MLATPTIRTSVLIKNQFYTVFFQSSPDLKEIEVLLVKPDAYTLDRDLVKAAIRSQYVSNPL